MEEKIRAMRIRATFMYPYLSAALLRLVLRESTRVPTMAVSMGGLVEWNPEYVSRLTIGEGAAVLTHEVWHLLRMHGERAPTEPEMAILWNIACDMAINDDLPGLPTGVLYPNHYGLPSNLLEEEYYELIKKMADKFKNHVLMVAAGDCGTAARGGEESADDSYSPLSETEKKIIARQVAEEVRRCGNAPDSVLRWAESILEPKVTWDRELRSVLLSSSARVIGKTDFLWAKRSRRASCTKAILPGMVSYKPKVAVVIDTSGSMSKSDLGRCLAELRGILKALADKVWVYVTDTVVHYQRSVSSIGEVRLIGGGGTEVSAGIIEAEKRKPDIIVVLSDFLTDWPDGYRPKPYVIGVKIGGYSAEIPPWVKVIEVE